MPFRINWLGIQAIGYLPFGLLSSALLYQLPFELYDHFEQ